MSAHAIPVSAPFVLNFHVFDNIDKEIFAEEGLSVADYEDEGCPNLWTFTGALYFCFTTGTTIGYGETAPNTFNGRLLFVFYVIPSICICGAFISEIGRLMYRGLHRGAVVFELVFGNKLVYWIIIPVSLTGFFIMMPAAVIHSFTGWNYFDATYFSIVTFTTVGFGDLTITDYNAKFLINMFTYFSLAFVGVIIGTATERLRESGPKSKQLITDDIEINFDDLDDRSVKTVESNITDL